MDIIEKLIWKIDNISYLIYYLSLVLLWESQKAWLFKSLPLVEYLLNPSNKG